MFLRELRFTLLFPFQGYSLPFQAEQQFKNSKDSTHTCPAPEGRGVTEVEPAIGYLSPTLTSHGPMPRPPSRIFDSASQPFLGSPSPGEPHPLTEEDSAAQATSSPPHVPGQTKPKTHPPRPPGHHAT